jgi:hypothetical protein
VTWQLAITLLSIFLGFLYATVLPFAVWLVKRDTANQVTFAAIRKEITEQASRFVTWEWVKELKTWQADQEKAQRERDALLQAEMKSLGESLAFLKGKMNGHTGG